MRRSSCLGYSVPHLAPTGFLAYPTAWWGVGRSDLAEEIIENLEAGLDSFRQVLAGLNKVA
jgi:hypothetical protein